MRNKLGTFCMLLGTALVLSALFLFVKNQLSSLSAEKTSAALLPLLVENIKKQRDSYDEDAYGNTLILPSTENIPSDGTSFEMAEVEIGGYSYIGYLSIPKLELELPIMADWDYSRLKIAPCRYFGSVKEENLVIMAHNFPGHFGRIDELSVGERIIFVDANGIAVHYEVATRDILSPVAVKEMTSGDFDLTLFTCTYGGQSRVTVYCSQITN